MTQKIISPSINEIHPSRSLYEFASFHPSARPTIPQRRSSALARFFRADNRYFPPIFITLILLVGNLSFGLLESFSRTALAITTSIAFEIA